MIEEETETETETEETTEEVETTEEATTEDSTEVEEQEEIHEDFEDLGDKAKKKAQKRFNKMTAKNYKLLDEVNQANAREKQTNDRLQAIEDRLSGETVKAPVETEAEPDRDTFDTDEDWYRALSKWETKKQISHTLKTIEIKEEKNRLQKEETDYQTNTEENFRNQTNVALAAHDDYLEVVANAPITTNTPLGREILGSKKHGAEILYQLGNDPELFAEVSKLKGNELIKKIGNLEYELDNSSKGDPAKKKKKAPDPANVNRRGTSHSGKPNINTMTPDDYYKQSCAVK